MPEKNQKFANPSIPVEADVGRIRGKDVVLKKIISCNMPTAWYYGCVGDVFKVVYGGKDDYILAEDFERGYKAMWRHILKSDCQTVETA